MVGVVAGERLRGLEWVWVAVAVPAVVLCSWVADPGEVPMGGLWYGFAAGLGQARWAG